MKTKDEILQEYVGITDPQEMKKQLRKDYTLPPPWKADEDYLQIYADWNASQEVSKVQEGGLNDENYIGLGKIKDAYNAGLYDGMNKPMKYGSAYNYCKSFATESQKAKGEIAFRKAIDKALSSPQPKAQQVYSKQDLKDAYSAGIDDLGNHFDSWFDETHPPSPSDSEQPEKR